MIKAKKGLGQNFLNDQWVARRIIDAVSPRPADIVLEIGPGTGALTRMLVEASGFVEAVEIDAGLAGELRRSIAAANLSVSNCDALSLDWESLISERKAVFEASGSGDKQRTRVRVVANLPYYISTPIIEKLLSMGRVIFDMTLMLQKEVADRITSGPGGKEYGALSVMVQYYCIASKLFEVPPSAFTPAPKVQSAVIRLSVRERPAAQVADEAMFFRLVRASFAQRRKTILNNLKAAAPALDFCEAPAAALETARVAPKRRAETLSIAEFADLCRALFRR